MLNSVQILNKKIAWRYRRIPVVSWCLYYFYKWILKRDSSFSMKIEENARLYQPIDNVDLCKIREDILKTYIREGVKPFGYRVFNLYGKDWKSKHEYIAGEEFWREFVFNKEFK